MNTLWPDVRFAPRRLGHVNMFVSDLAASYAFYREVCGLELAFDERDLLAKFLSNGSSHHDLAIMQSTAQALVGRDGEVQIGSERGSHPGLNHLAFEVPSEAWLVAGIERARSSGLEMDSFYDHLVSRSVYVPGPDDVEVELYADSTTQWRELFRDLDSGLMSARWVPGADGPPSEEQHFTVDFEPRPVVDAIARPRRTARAAVVAEDLEVTLAYYCRVVGLTPVEVDADVGRWALLGGSLGGVDLVVLEARDKEALGFHHLGLELESLEALDDTLRRARAAGVEVEREVAHAKQRAIVLRDPDNVPVQFFASDPDGASLTWSSVYSDDVRSYLA